MSNRMFEPEKKRIMRCISMETVIKLILVLIVVGVLIYVVCNFELLLVGIVRWILSVMKKVGSILWRWALNIFTMVLPLVLLVAGVVYLLKCLIKGKW